MWKNTVEAGRQATDGKYSVIRKSEEHFKNSQQMYYAADCGHSSPMERETLQGFQEKACAHSCPDFLLRDSSSRYGVQ
jgi:hypothetical protein